MKNSKTSINDSSWNIKIARSRKEIEDLRPIWDQWQEDLNADIDFYLCVINSSPDFLRPHVILLMKDGAPRGMLVGRLEVQRIPCRLGYMTIFNPNATILAIIYGGVLGNVFSEEAQILLKELLDFLKRGEVDAIRFDFLKRDSDLYRAAKMMPGFFQRDRFTPPNKHIRMDLPSDHSQLFNSMSSKHRYWLRRLPRILDKEMPDRVAIKYFNKEEDLCEFSTDADKIAKKTYQRGIGISYENNDTYNSRLSLWARKNCLLASILYIDNKPCAFWLSILYRGRCYLWLTGYDQTYKKYELGTILLVNLIEHICHNYKGVREVDFGFGDASYKRHFGSHIWEENGVYVFRNSLRGVGINFIRTIIGISAEYADRVLTQTNLRSKIKKFWRGQMQV